MIASNKNGQFKYHLNTTWLRLFWIEIKIRLCIWQKCDHSCSGVFIYVGHSVVPNCKYFTSFHQHLFFNIINIGLGFCSFQFDYPPEAQDIQLKYKSLSWFWDFNLVLCNVNCLNVRLAGIVINSQFSKNYVEFHARYDIIVCK